MASWDMRLALTCLLLLGCYEFHRVDVVPRDGGTDAGRRDVGVDASGLDGAIGDVPLDSCSPGWVVDPIPGAFRATDAAITIDRGDVHVAYADATGFWYALREDGVWSTQPVVPSHPAALGNRGLSFSRQGSRVVLNHFGELSDGFGIWRSSFGRMPEQVTPTDELFLTLPAPYVAAAETRGGEVIAHRSGPRDLSFASMGIAGWVIESESLMQPTGRQFGAGITFDQVRYHAYLTRQPRGGDIVVQLIHRRGSDINGLELDRYPREAHDTPCPLDGFDVIARSDGLDIVYANAELGLDTWECSIEHVVVDRFGEGGPVRGLPGGSRSLDIEADESGQIHLVTADEDVVRYAVGSRATWDVMFPPLPVADAVRLTLVDDEPWIALLPSDGSAVQVAHLEDCR